MADREHEAVRPLMGELAVLLSALVGFTIGGLYFGIRRFPDPASRYRFDRAQDAYTAAINRLREDFENISGARHPAQDLADYLDQRSGPGRQ